MSDDKQVPKVHIEIGQDKEMQELRDENQDLTNKLAIIADREFIKNKENVVKTLGIDESEVNLDNISAYINLAKKKETEKRFSRPEAPHGDRENTAWLNPEDVSDKRSLADTVHDSPQEAIAFLVEVSKNQQSSQHKEAKQILDQLGKNVMAEAKKKGFELEYQGELKYLLGNRANPSFYKNENELLEKRTKELMNRTNWKRIS